MWPAPKSSGRLGPRLRSGRPACPEASCGTASPDSANPGEDTLSDERSVRERSRAAQRRCWRAESDLRAAFTDVPGDVTLCTNASTCHQIHRKSTVNLEGSAQTVSNKSILKLVPGERKDIPERRRGRVRRTRGPCSSGPAIGHAITHTDPGPKHTRGGSRMFEKGRKRSENMLEHPRTRDDVM